MGTALPNLPPTIQQIADACGVSRPTANLILTDKGQRYSAQTRRKVLSTARRLGYRPNAAARATRTGRFNAFGLLLSTDYGLGRLTEPLFHALRLAMGRRSLHLIVGDLPDERLQDDQELPRILSEWSVDGLLINYTHRIPPRMLELIGRERLPAIWLNTQLPANCVYPDDYVGGRTAGEQLISRGHRRIVYVTGSGPAEHYSYEARYRGYCDALREAGLQPRAIGYRQGAGFSTHGDALELLSTADRPTAMVAYGYAQAVPAVSAAAQLGLRIPEDLSILAFHHEAVEVAGWALSTLVIDSHSMAETAVQMLADRLEPGATSPARVVPLLWLPRQSLAEPPHGERRV